MSKQLRIIKKKKCLSRLQNYRIATHSVFLRLRRAKLTPFSTIANRYIIVYDHLKHLMAIFCSDIILMTNNISIGSFSKTLFPPKSYYFQRLSTGMTILLS